MRFALSLLLLLAGCYPAPISTGHCLAPSLLRSDTLDCEALTTHEDITAPRYARTLAGWTVVLRKDTTWSDKHQRLFFSDPSLPGFEIWGMTDYLARTIHLADEELYRAVLAHEECHAHFPGEPHEAWSRLGCDVVELEVRKALSPADGVIVAPLELIPVSLDDGRVAHGIAEGAP